MARQSTPTGPNGIAALKLWLGYGALGIGALALLIGAILAWNWADRWLASDPRFKLQPPDAEGRSPGLEIRGHRYVPLSRILEVFAPDFGRSIYLIPLEQRCMSLMNVEWVREATVSRIWPNRLLVHIVERNPVAFAHLPPESGQGPAEVMLIDAEGVLLSLPPRATFRLPVLLGLRRTHSLQSRRQRVGAALRLLAEAGPHADRISEIDVSDPSNLKTLLELEGKAILLWVGDHNFGPRLKRFYDHFGEIQQKLPEASTFDLRLDDRIIAIPEGGSRG